MISTIFEQAIHHFSLWIRVVQCNSLTDIFDLVYLCFALNVQRVQLCAELITASQILKQFGEVGANFSLQLSSLSGFAKIKHKKVIDENQCVKHKIACLSSG